jgi:hypothetical protein
MSHESLRRLADEGLSAFPPSGLIDIANWCWEYGEATADARYCILWRILKSIAEPFEDNGALSVVTVAQIDTVLHCYIPIIVDARSIQTGVHLVRLMKDELAASVYLQ